MLTLRKKPSEASDLAQAPWHPDFRNSRRLPDTKTIRTSFLLNGLVVLLAAVSLIYFVFQVYQWRDVSAQVDQWQLQLDRDKGPSDQAVALYKKFQAESVRVNEILTFVNSRPIVSEILLRLGDTLPSYVAIDRFDLGATHLNIRGTVRGAPDQASGRASVYLELLRADAFFQEKFSEINLVSLNRDPKSDGLLLDLSFKIKGAK